MVAVAEPHALALGERDAKGETLGDGELAGVLDPLPLGDAEREARADGEPLPLRSGDAEAAEQGVALLLLCGDAEALAHSEARADAVSASVAAADAVPSAALLAEGAPEGGALPDGAPVCVASAVGVAGGLPDARALRVPLLLVWGDDDRLHPAAEATTLEAAVPGARHLAIPGGRWGHPEERPWALADAIAGTLAGG
jgi:pimeloyl-ACP methyl ester carboxylesterase